MDSFRNSLTSWAVGTHRASIGPIGSGHRAIGPPSGHRAIGPQNNRFTYTWMCANSVPEPIWNYIGSGFVKSKLFNRVPHQHLSFNSHLDLWWIGPVGFLVGSGRRHPIWKIHGSGQSSQRAHRAPQMRAAEIPSGFVSDRAGHRAH